MVGVVGLEHGEDEMVIARLFVAPAFFRRGVGSALVAHALAQAAGAACGSARARVTRRRWPSTSASGSAGSTRARRRRVAATSSSFATP